MGSCSYAAVMAWFGILGGAGPGAGGGPGLPPDVPLRSIFSNYIYPGIDWAALDEPGCDAVLRRCIGGAGRSDLAGLGIGDLEKRLARLEEGKLLRRSGDRYSLPFPVIAGEAQARLQASIRATAPGLVPAAREIVQEIDGRVKGDGRMLYHLTWSVVMDGFMAWKAVELHLRRSLHEETIDLATCWWLYPNHPFRAGTNSCMRPAGLLTISSNRSAPGPEDVRGALCASEDSFLLSSVRGESIPKDRGGDKLRSYGLVDGSGRSALFMPDVSSPLVPALVRCSARFGRLAARRLDIDGIARGLDLAPQAAAVIAYHELCYEILGALGAAGDLAIPEVSKDDPRAMRYLVSFIPLTPGSQKRFEEIADEAEKELLRADQ